MPYAICHMPYAMCKPFVGCSAMLWLAMTRDVQGRGREGGFEENNGNDDGENLGSLSLAESKLGGWILVRLMGICF